MHTTSQQRKCPDKENVYEAWVILAWCLRTIYSTLHITASDICLTDLVDLSSVRLIRPCRNSEFQTFQVSTALRHLRPSSALISHLNKQRFSWAGIGTILQYCHRRRFCLIYIQLYSSFKESSLKGYQYSSPSSSSKLRSRTAKTSQYFSKPSSS